MEKFCPKCGKKVSATAKFCPHCGYNFALRNNNQSISTPKVSREQAKPVKKKRKGKTGILVISLQVVLAAAGGGYYYWNQNSSQTQASQSAKSSSNSTSHRQASQHSTQKSESSSSDDSVEEVKLSNDIGPKESAAAVTYFAAKNDIDGWKSMTNSDDLKVDLSTDDDLLNSLSATGQGMAYVISDDGNSGDRKLVYTIDKDDTINIYSLPSDYDPDSTYQPVKSLPKADMIESINDHHYAFAVKKLQDKVTINQ